MSASAAGGRPSAGRPGDLRAPRGDGDDEIRYARQEAVLSHVIAFISGAVVSLILVLAILLL